VRTPDGLPLHAYALRTHKNRRGGATCRAGPIWINTNALIAYGLASLGMRAQAVDVAGRIVSLLAADIRKVRKTPNQLQPYVAALPQEGHP
jgi:hypothetical protein